MSKIASSLFIFQLQWSTSYNLKLNFQLKSVTRLSIPIIIKFTDSFFLYYIAKSNSCRNRNGIDVYPPGGKLENRKTRFSPDIYLDPYFRRLHTSTRITDLFISSIFERAMKTSFHFRPVTYLTSTIAQPDYFLSYLTRNLFDAVDVTHYN